MWELNPRLASMTSETSEPSAQNGRSPDLSLADSPQSQVPSWWTPLPSCRHALHEKAEPLNISPPIHAATHPSYHDHTTAPQKPQQAYISPYTRLTRPTSPPSFASTDTLNECCAPVCAPGPRPAKKMGLSKTQRICVLLAIDAVFFLIELVVGEYLSAKTIVKSPLTRCAGYAVHSLALVADSFHMLNDVLSLCVGLWAVRVANTGNTKTYMYGW